MIGLAGPDINTWDLDILDDLCQVIPLRGTDGSGIVQGRRSFYGPEKFQDLLIDKTNQDMNFFRKYHKYSQDGNKDLFRGVGNHFFAIHARAATIGDLSKNNAHPFDVGDLIGMHNGTLKDGKYLNKTHTDSQLMFEDMQERGVKTVLEELDPQSAFAVVVIDKKTGRIHFSRNEHRPLYFCYHEKRSVMYWASEGWMLRELLKRRRESIKDDTIWYFSPNVLYSIDPHKIVKNTDKMERVSLEKPFRKQEKKKNKVRVKAKVFSQINRNTNNVIPFKQEDKEKKSIIPVSFCCGCQRKLKLVEQYFSRKIGQTVYLCGECESEDQNIQQARLN